MQTVWATRVPDFRSFGVVRTCRSFSVWSVRPYVLGFGDLLKFFSVKSLRSMSQRTVVGTQELPGS